jgi:hypothetical protein
MGIIHGLSFVIFLILAIYSEKNIPYALLTSDFSYFDVTFKPLIQALGNYKLSWVLLSFPLITCLFHIYISIIIYKDYKYKLLFKGIQAYRWIEYSITAGIMTWVIWALSGGTNIFIGLSLVVLNLNMNIYGYITELVNSTRSKNIINNQELKNSSSYIEIYEYLYKKKYELKDKVIFWPIILGFLNFGLIWGIILSYFFEAIASNSSNVPWWIWTIDIGLLIQFLNFGLVMLFHYMSKQYLISKCRTEYQAQIPTEKSFGLDYENKLNSQKTYQKPYPQKTLSESNNLFKSHNMNISNISKVKNNQIIFFFASRLNYEFSYQILSLTSKLFLTWFLYIGLSR